MPEHYTPQPRWQDETCYIIGGGTSLKNFDWHNLDGRNVIGCNVAFYLGAKLVPTTVFGDAAFLRQQKSGLEKYAQSGGEIITCAHSIDRFNPPSYIKLTKKQNHGLSVDGLGWNGNTGSLAINLALSFGATKIYLLGYDMCIAPDGNKNYHNCYNDTPQKAAYIRFKKGMSVLSRDIHNMYPDCSVINLEDDTSELDVFPKESLKAHFESVK